MLGTIKPRPARTPDRRARLDLEQLGDRVVPAAQVTAAITYNSSGMGVLSVEGTEAGDVIDIRQEGGIVTVQGRRIAATFPGLGTLAVGSVYGSSLYRIAVLGLGGNDTVKFQTVLGGSSTADRLIPVRIDGGWGDDTLTGGDGSDTLIGGPGSDDLSGGRGADTLFGDQDYTGVGTALRPLGPREERYDFARNVYYPEGESSTNVDSLAPWYAATSDGNDTLRGGDMDDALYGGYGNDTLWGGAGNDQLSGMGGADFLVGDGGTPEPAGNDYLFGGTGNDYLLGGPGHDELVGGLNDDWMFGGEGDDNLYGGDGNDRMYGEAGMDAMLGGSGNDYLDGGDGGDVLFGDDTDLLFGPVGRDVLIGGRNDRARDQLFGGYGADTFYPLSTQDFWLVSNPIQLFEDIRDLDDEDTVAW